MTGGLRMAVTINEAGWVTVGFKGAMEKRAFSFQKFWRADFGSTIVEIVDEVTFVSSWGKTKEVKIKLSPR